MKIYHADKYNCDENKCTTPVWWRLPRLKVPNCSLTSPQLRYKISLIHIEHPVQSCSTIYLLPRARVCSIICINQIFWHFYEYCSTYNAYCSTFTYIPDLWLRIHEVDQKYPGQKYIPLVFQKYIPNQEPTLEPGSCSSIN